MVKTWAKRLYMAFIFLLLYLPIIVLVILSFNKSKAELPGVDLLFNGMQTFLITVGSWMPSPPP